MNYSHETVRTMEKYGGGFVNALAQAWYVADATNKAILEKSFKHYFDQYEQMTKEQQQ